MLGLLAHQTHRLMAAVLAILALSTASQAAPSQPARPAQRIEQEIVLHRATQAVYWGLPAVAFRAIRRSAERDLGATWNDVIYMSRPLAARHGFLTANNQTPYFATMLNLADGPTVIELPPANERIVVFGTAMDAWQGPLVDFGPRGADRGQGGKFLFLPPGHAGPVPEGYIVVRSPTHFVLVLAELVN